MEKVVRDVSRRIELSHPLTTINLGQIVKGNKNADRIVLEILKNEKPAVLDGYTVTGMFINPLGQGVPIHGKIEGNMLTATLSDGCYHIAGLAGGFINVADATDIITVVQFTAEVLSNGSGVIYDPDKVIGSLDELLEKIAEMEIAVREAIRITQESIESIGTEGAAQIAAAKAEGAAQIAAIEQKGAATLETIPEDYAKIDADVKSLKDTKADAIIETSAKAASHELYAQDAPMHVTLYGKTTQSGSGNPSPDNVRTISGVDAAHVHAGSNNANAIDLPLLPDGKPLYGDGTVDDTVENDVLVDGERKGRITRRWDSITLDGNVEFYDYNSHTWGEYVYFRFSKGTFNTKAAVVPLSDSLVGFSYITSGREFVSTHPTTDGYLYFGLKASRLGIESVADANAVIDAAKTYLAANPIHVVYQLAAPEVYSTDPQELRRPDDGNPVKVLSTGETVIEYAVDLVHYISSKETPDIETDKGLPPYWMDYLQGKTDELQEAVLEAGSKTDIFAYLTDVHIKQNSAAYSALILDWLKSNIPVNRCIMGGDVLNTIVGQTRETARKCLYRYYQMYCTRGVLNVLGNHETGQFNTDGDKFTTDEIYNPFFCTAETVTDTLGKPYYSFDNTSKKTRYIVLDNAQVDFNNDTEQAAWLADTLMDMQDGYTAILFAHRYIAGSLDSAGAGDKQTAITQIAQAYNAKTSTTINGVDMDFTGAHGVVACLLCGHVHYDFSMVDNDILVICTTTDAGWDASNSQFDGVTRSAGTTDEHAIDLFFVDTEHRKISTKRIGFGADREWTY